MLSNSPNPVVSVVICFRDWGLQRLLASVKLHLLNSALETEVIVSDYGSAEPDVIQNQVEAAGGRVVRSNTAHMPWSRAAALNAGVEEARGEVIITTDADIMFSPRCYLDALQAVRRHPSALYLVQCRDLPPSHDVAFFENAINAGQEIDFEELGKISTLRPRWGMGGFAAFTLESFYRLNGLEERMTIWGAEDADFVKRFGLNRMPVRWLSRNDTAIFHIWHESSQKQANEIEETRKAVALNRKIFEEDNTPVRNLSRAYRRSVPLLSIVIPTYKRPSFLKQTLQSCQAQTFSNFEVIVVENGDSEVGEEVVTGFSDPRFRYIKTDKAGASAARNVGNVAARGHYIVIQDDDDLMISTRLERHLAALDGGRFHGTYCGWIDFSDKDESSRDLHPGKEHSFAAMLAQGRVIIHAGLMLEASILKSYKYDESRSAGIDFALLLLLTYHGLHIAHTGSYGLLRRFHDRNMTSEQSAVQKESAILGVQSITQYISENELSTLKNAGRHASMLSCDNEEDALEELTLYLGGQTPPLTVPRYQDNRAEGLMRSTRQEAWNTQLQREPEAPPVQLEFPRQRTAEDGFPGISGDISRRRYAEELEHIATLSSELGKLDSQRAERKNRIKRM